MSELELKLRVPAAELPSLREALQRRGARVVTLRASYFDTVDGALARREMVLRLRHENDRVVQTFKAGGDSPVHRLEHEVFVVPTDPPPAVDISRHDGHPAGRLLREALGHAVNERAGALVCRQRTEVERLICPVIDAHGSVIEIALDTGRVLAGERQRAIAELELEHQEGPVTGLFALAGECMRHGGLWLSTVSKAARGDQLLRGGAPIAVRASTVVVSRAHGKPDGDALLRAVLRSALEQVLPNASEVAEDEEAPELVHQLRVGLRRLRTALRELAPLSPAIDPVWNEVLAQTFATLGAQRDREVVMDVVQPLLPAAGIEPPPRAATRDARADVGAAVRDLAFQQVLLSVLALVHADAPLVPELDAAGIRAFMARRLDKLHRQVRRDGRRFDELPLEQQHRVRKRLKRLRYLAEFAMPLWKDKDVEQYLDRLKPAQDMLGRHNDVAVAMALYRQEAERPAAAMAAGFLQGHLQTTERAGRQALQKIRNRHRFWSVPKKPE